MAAATSIQDDTTTTTTSSSQEQGTDKHLQRHRPLIGYWAAHEQYSMHDLLDFVTDAEREGFTSTMTSDHFHPWWNDNAYGNFTWVWIAAAAERTKNMQFVTGVTSPVYRYNPAIIAQAFASLDVLYPGRVGLGLGTGEAMNELPLGFNWPKGSVRLERTREAIEIIKALWRGGSNQEKGEEEEPNTATTQSRKQQHLERKKGSERSRKQRTVKKSRTSAVDIDGDGFVTYNGKYYKIRKAKLYTPPYAPQPIPLYFAAAAKHSTKIAAQYSDGIVTFLKAEGAEPLIRLFDKTAEAAGRDVSALEKIVEYKVSYNEDYDKALNSSMFWRATLLKNVFDSKIADPRELERKAKIEVSEEAVKKSVEVTTSIEDCIKSIEEYIKVGFTRVYVHSTSPDEREFIKSFSKQVMPYFSSSREGQ